MNRLSSFFLTLMLVLATATAGHTETTERLVQLIDYVGVDYGEAVEGGSIRNQVEYAEMLEFAGVIEETILALPASERTAGLSSQAALLKQLVEAKAPVMDIRSVTRLMRASITRSFDLKVSPEKVPGLERGKALYMEMCAACHGLAGDGNGTLAEGLEPQPTDFTDVQRYEQRSLYALFNTITYGVEGTGMAAYQGISTRDRWSLAAFVGQMAVSAEKAAAGKQAWKLLQGSADPIDIKAYASLSPLEAAENWTGGSEIIAYLRTVPGVIFDHKTQPLGVARQALQSSLAAYGDGRQDEARKWALTAYLDGFELVETSLAAVAPGLMQQIEREMFLLRGDLKDRESQAQVASRIERLQSLLQRAEMRLEEKGSLTPTAAFLTSFIILLREGLEALLVVVALSAFLIKTDRRDAMPYLHAGWIAALLLGVVTWIVSEQLVEISGATREVSEGVAALAAAGMLLFVGYWLHSKTSADGWQAFIHGSMKKALDRRTLWGLTGLSFISVYREVFETILFYQALWVQATSGSANGVISGFFAAALVLVVVAALVIKYSVYLPLRQFFASTGILLLILSFIFAGKGIAALQEAGKIPLSLVQFPAVEWLGIFPSLEGLLLQSVILLLALGMVFRGVMGKKKPA